MTLQLIKIQDLETVSPFYCVVLDGNMIPNGWSGDYDEALELYNKIVADPTYLNTRKVILHSATV